MIRGLVICSFGFLALLSVPTQAQETWIHSDPGEGVGDYYNEVYKLDTTTGRFLFTSHTQIHRAVGMGRYEKTPLQITFYFDSLQAPTVFPENRRPPAGSTTTPGPPIKWI